MGDSTYVFIMKWHVIHGFEIRVKYDNEVITKNLALT